MATALEGHGPRRRGAAVAAEPGTGPLAMTLIVLGFAGVWLIALLVALRLMMLPAEANGRLYVMFAPGTTADEVYGAIIRAGGQPIGAAVGSWSFEAFGEDSGFVGRLEEEGALAAFRTTPLGIPLAGCLGIPKTPEQRPGYSPGL